MPEKHTFAHGGGCDDEIYEEECVEVAPAFVTAKLLDSPGNINQCAFEKPKVVPSPNHRVTHILNSTARCIITPVPPE